MDDCQNQIRDQDSSVKFYFCLFSKDYINTCPPNCPYFVKGLPVRMNLIYQNNFEMECPYFHLMASITPQDKQQFICVKTGLFPNCEQCSFVRSSNSEENNSMITTN